MSDLPFEAILTESDALKRMMVRGTRVAQESVPILIEGEPGTGKLLFARALHAASPRRDQPFESLTVGAVPPGEVAARLFGSEDEGSQPCEGVISRARGGSILIDEVGELPADAQIRLREFVQTGELRPIGSQRGEPIDVRIISASHGSLLDEVRRGRVRLELYYQLAVAIIRLAPLRERPQDLRLLIERFLGQLPDAQGRSKQLTKAAHEHLMAQPWHGNVRELENVIRRVVLWSPESRIQLDDVRDALDDARGPHASDILYRPLGDSFRIDEILAEVESHYIRMALDRTGGNKARAADILGLNSATTLTNRIEKHGLA